MTGLLHEIDQRYRAEHRLQAVMIELTHACPCDCAHCYLVRDPRDELSCTEIADIFDQLHQEGTVNLGLTGGEPMLRRDFPRILEMAHEHRFFVSVLTTGVTIGAPEIRLLQRNGVRLVELSILGARSRTHDGIMRHEGAFARLLTAARGLREAGIGVGLKCTIMKANQDEVEDMARLADELGARFSASISVMPRVDGDPAPLALALSEDEVARLDPRHTTGGLIPGEDHSQGALLTCRAGSTVAGISPRGEVFPCILIRHAVGDLRQRRLQDIWHDDPQPFLTELRGISAEDVAACHDCELRSVCRRCPGVAYQESGELRQPSPSACACARGIAANITASIADDIAAGTHQPR